MDHTKISELIAESLPGLLESPVLQLAYRQRAKFEQWLKFELAWRLTNRGATVEVEFTFFREGRNSYLADLRAQIGDQRPALVELKAINTSFGFPGIPRKTKPMTDN